MIRLIKNQEGNLKSGMQSEILLKSFIIANLIILIKSLLFTPCSLLFGPPGGDKSGQFGKQFSPS